MSQVNRPRSQMAPPGRTHEGAPSVTPYLPALAQLKRAVSACLLWEDSFYESGVEIATRIETLAKEVPFADLAALAIEARTRLNLRHAPLHLAVAAIRAKKEHGRAVGDLINAIIQRADEPAEFLSLYWKSQPNAPLTKQMKVGLGRAIRKFDAYQLAKYKGAADKSVRLRDVLFLVHGKPRDEGLYKALADDTLVPADTWEVSLSAGKDKRETFERLMAERRLPSMAFLRNLRNMVQAGVANEQILGYAMKLNVDKILPFRFIAAAVHNPQFEPMLEPLMLRATASLPRLPGHTAILVDNSGSMAMAGKISGKSELSQIDAACGLAILARETCEEARCFAFSDRCVEVPPRRGFALRDAIKASMPPAATYLGMAVNHVYAAYPACDRLIVITDEQSADRPSHPRGKGYIINVASYQNGIAYGPWQTITGFSEQVLTYIRESEEA
jgi:60 kDa SS-A/Ro ribonucleoprotein